MPRQVSIRLLLDPTSSQHGKFYLLALDPTAHFGVYGPNSSSSTGQIAQQSSLSTAQKLLQEKLRKGYRDAQPNEISRPALQNMAKEIARQLGLPTQITHRFVNSTVLEFGVDTAAPAPTPTNTGAKPRLRSKEGVDVWF